MTVAFIGHRKIAHEFAQQAALREIIRDFIVQENADTFLFGSRSEFDALCYNIVSELQKEYPHIRRVYVRAEYPYIHNDYKAYLRTLYEESFYPPEILHAGYKVYVERNRKMVDMCDLLVCYCNERIQRASGTLSAVHYARRRPKRICNVFA